MTSTVKLAKRLYVKKYSDAYDTRNFSVEDGLTGGDSGHYLIDGGSKMCHPDFVAIPIGDPEHIARTKGTGYFICSRKEPRKQRPGKKRSIGHTAPSRCSLQMYPQQRQDKCHPMQLQNPERYEFGQRRVPNEAYLIANDYLYRERAWHGTGVGDDERYTPRVHYTCGVHPCGTHTCG